MSLSCIIVEDLQVAANYLIKCCEKSKLVEVKGHFTNVPDALSFVNENTVDLVFLDVEMPGPNGFELLDQMAFLPKIILTTSKKEYAYDAFEYKVTDFLKKPFTYERFLEALRKAQTAPDLPGAENTPAAETDVSDHIYIKSDGKLIRLSNDSILFIESMGDYVKFVTADKKYITHNTIKNLEDKVNKHHFLKVHRSYIVNLHKIDDMRENCLFISGAEIPVSKAFKPIVISRLNIL
ncbi:MAG TPA: LytTR family DNA-binding domain-containing protein [Puia sp.]